MTMAGELRIGVFSTRCSAIGRSAPDRHDRRQPGNPCRVPTDVRIFDAQAGFRRQIHSPQNPNIDIWRVLFVLRRLAGAGCLEKGLRRIAKIDYGQAVATR